MAHAGLETHGFHPSLFAKALTIRRTRWEFAFKHFRNSSADWRRESALILTFSQREKGVGPHPNLLPEGEGIGPSS